MQELDSPLCDEDQLSVELIEAQYALKNTYAQPNAKSLLILVSGIELAGKGEAVKQLREWVDPRFLRVKADKPNRLTVQQPFWQPYARFIPEEGQIVVLFGNWYGDLISSAMQASSTIDDSLFDDYVERMRAFEQDLKNNHVDVLKVWFDLPWKVLQKRLDNIDPMEMHWHKLHGLDWRNKKQYDVLQRLRQRFTHDWCIVDGEDEQRRNQQFAQRILQALKHCPTHLIHAQGTWKQAEIPKVLLGIEKNNNSEKQSGLKQLMRQVAQAVRHDSRNVIIVFEGMDAAGKGGSIKRIVKHLDPREYEIHSIAAPQPHELHRPYLWRFWTKLQAENEICIFDRSWYGRVLVERVEGFAKVAEWQRAYDEINRFEEGLTNSQTVIVKIWLAISKDEQLERFKVREEIPHKRFKITPEDWRNRERWDDYLNAAADILERTNSKVAPWYVIATDDKKSARIQVLQAILKQLSA